MSTAADPPGQELRCSTSRPTRNDVFGQTQWDSTPTGRRRPTATRGGTPRLGRRHPTSATGCVCVVIGNDGQTAAEPRGRMRKLRTAGPPECVTTTTTPPVDIDPQGHEHGRKGRDTSRGSEIPCGVRNWKQSQNVPLFRWPRRP